MTVEQMRSELAMAYPDSPSWRKKIKTYPEYRIIGMYKDFVEHGRFEKLKKIRKNTEVQLRMEGV